MAHGGIEGTISGLAGALGGGSDRLHARRPVDTVRRPDEVRSVAPKASRPSSGAAESARILASDLEPLAGLDSDALLAEMTRIELALSRRSRSGGDATALDIGTDAIRETVRRLRLVQSAGDALIVGSS